MANVATGDLSAVRVTAGGDNARSSDARATLPARRGIRSPRFHGLRKCQRNPLGPLIPRGGREEGAAGDRAAAEAAQGAALTPSGSFAGEPQYPDVGASLEWREMLRSL
ncbi:hypothetical protein RR46_10348 [Papilio xuthus]|uniref:Uncharacterized protein n=1 Tax=Papilio xuthus TaxID=66420 RepID=A0A194Q6K5_PAPXU|nr:hypothetical protein RR46_10348 [Papilio xuthus]